MKYIGKILSLSLFGLTGISLVSCSNELKDPNNNDSNIIGNIQLVKAPDVIAWSGNEVLGNTFGKNVSSLPSTNSAYVPGLIEETISFQKPEGAVDITASNVDRNASVYFVPESYQGKLNIDLNAGTTIYNYGKLILDKNVNGDGILTVYNSGELDWQISSGKRHTVYNQGTLDVLNYANIGHVYNLGGNLILDYPHNEWWAGQPPYKADIPDAMFIYSEGGSVKIPCDGDLKSTTEIHGTLLVEGNLNIQNSTDKYICGLVVEGDLNIDSDVTSSYIEANDMVLNGDNVFLTEGGHISADKISFEGNGVTADDNEYEAIKAIGTKALVETDSFYCKNDKLGNHLGVGVYANFETITYNDGGTLFTTDAENYVDELLAANQVNNNEVSGEPACGEPWGPKETPEGDPTVGNLTTSEVEVNLSILDKHEAYDIADLVTKLSIHVRAATDVKIVIPVPRANYCDVDDMYIFTEHYEGVYGGSESEPAVNTISYEIIPGHVVTLTVEFNQDNITVFTEGIDEEVFEYCQTYYGDGINFEVYNYFNNLRVDEEGNPVKDENGKFQSNGFDRSALQNLLNQSTVQFLDNYPDYYINAFNMVDGEVNEGDCEVSIIKGQRNVFGDAHEDIHLNTGDKNRIYKNKEFDGPEGKHDHDFLWNL